MAVDRPGMREARGKPFYVWLRRRAAAGEPKVDVRLKKTDSRIAGASFSNQPPPRLGGDAHWRGGASWWGHGSADELIGGTWYLPVTGAPHCRGARKWRPRPAKFGGQNSKFYT